MTDVLIRNVSPETLDRIDQDAAAAGLSRSAYLRHQLDQLAGPLFRVTMEDLRRSTALARGVLDDDLMRGAWE